MSLLACESRLTTRRKRPLSQQMSWLPTKASAFYALMCSCVLEKIHRWLNFSSATDVLLSSNSTELLPYINNFVLITQSTWLPSLVIRGAATSLEVRLLVIRVLRLCIQTLRGTWRLSMSSLWLLPLLWGRGCFPYRRM